jgi:tetratricopeptide (TPR) repeat protein
MLGSYVTTLMLFPVCARFRQPLVPTLILFAVFAVMQIIDLIRTRRWKHLGIVVVVLFVLLLESNHNITGLTEQEVKAENLYIIGTSLMEQKNIDGAIRNYQRAVRINPQHAQAQMKLGMLYAQRGEDQKALVAFGRAVAAEPTSPEAHYNYATALEAAGRLQEAAKVLERAVRVFTLNDAIFARLGAVYYQLGRAEESKAALGRALEINPGNEMAQNLYRGLFTEDSANVSGQN